MVKVTVDGVQVDVPAGSSVLQACEIAGKEIPRFCYHERLSVAGNCRMCLVQVNNSPRLAASCAFPVAEGMTVQTDTEIVRKARRATMEFLLINHPLDCPICDQGGECDLQDQAMGYGRDHSRFAENKRAVQEKDFGPLVKTAMTRCILCTRCVRFMTEVAGVPELGGISRGENTEITTYVEKALGSELSGNLIDICPVGALTSKPYAFVARPWELKRTNAIDVHDALGSNIQAQRRGPEILRIVPRIHDGVNEEWLSDKGRFSVDGLKYRRLDRPWVRVHGQLHSVSWQDAFVALAKRLEGVPGHRIGAIAGDLCDAESLCALKDLMTALGSENIDCRQDGAQYDLSRREHYLFNSTIAGIDEADALLIIGSVPRHEAPVLNARIRARFLAGQAKIGVVGPAGVDHTYPVEELGDDPRVLLDILEGGHPFSKTLEGASRPLIIVGSGALTRGDSLAIQAAAWSLARKYGALTAEWNGYNVLHHAASRVAALDMGFVPGPTGRSVAGMMSGGVDVLWVLGADDFHTDQIGPSTFVVYQGHHGDACAERADIILPGASYLEKAGTYVNTEGRMQRSFQAVFPPGEAREDWRILRAFSEVVGCKLPYDTLDALRERMKALSPVFAVPDVVPVVEGEPGSGPSGDSAAVRPEALRAFIQDYYQTNSIARSSPTMAQCSRVFVYPAIQAAE